MSERYTYRDVVRAAIAYRDAIERVGLECPSLIVERGSKTNGNAWGLVAERDRRSGPPIGSAVIGYDRSARSAYEDLTTRTRAIGDLRHLLGIPPHETTTDRNAAEVLRVAR